MSYIADKIDDLPTAGGTRLVSDRFEAEVLTANAETDARGALMRGLREYLNQQSLPWNDGQEIRFRAVVEDWAEPGDDAVFPAVALRTEEPMDYGDECGDNAIFTVPGPGAGIQLMRVTQCHLHIVVETWSQNPEQRRGVVAMLEAAFNPVDWMYGFRLFLPHYHGAVSSWSSWNSEYVDDEEDRARRYVKAVGRISGYVRQYRVLGPGVRLQPEVKLRINGEDAD